MWCILRTNMEILAGRNAFQPSCTLAWLFRLSCWHFSVLIILTLSKVMLILEEFTFMGINMFWVILRVMWPLPWSSGLNESKLGPKHNYACKHKLYHFMLTKYHNIPGLFRCSVERQDQMEWHISPPLIFFYDLYNLWDTNAQPTVQENYLNSYSYQ